MIAYAWPIALVVVSNLIYQICAKSMPDGTDPYAALTVTYLVGAVVSAVLYYTIGGGDSLLREYTRLNWVPFVLGISIVGLEVGCIFTYKVGWPISTASIVQSSFLAAALLVVGLLLYRETITLNKAIGIVICMVGLYFINK